MEEGEGYVLGADGRKRRMDGTEEEEASPPEGKWLVGGPSLMEEDGKELLGVVLVG